jgi:hypothetical protein
MCIEVRTSPMIALSARQYEWSTASVVGRHVLGGELFRLDSLPKEGFESVPSYAERTDVQRPDVLRKVIAHDRRTRRSKRLRAEIEPCQSRRQ